MDLRPLIFMPALVGAVIFGFIFLLYLCDAYLTTLEDTASGAKQIAWTRESVTDNFWKFWYLGWLIGLWLGPACFLGRAMTAGLESSWMKLLAPLVVLWICYPISQLSSLSASSVWMPLVPDVFVRLAQKPKVVFEFFCFTVVVVLVFGVAFQWAFLTEGDWLLLLLGPPIVVVMTLLYARLLGRLAFVLRFTKGLGPSKRDKKRAVVEIRDRDEPVIQKPRRSQPGELTPLDTPEGELSGYEVRFEDEPAPLKKRVKAVVVEKQAESEQAMVVQPPLVRRPTPDSALERGRVWCAEDDEETTGYGVHEAEVKLVDRIPDEVVKPRESELRLLAREDRPKKPKRVWCWDLLAFLFHAGTIRTIVVASVLSWVMGVMIRIARQFNPAMGGG